MFPEMWYRISLKEFRDNGGSILLDMHDGSLFKLFNNLYHEVDWKPWMQGENLDYYWEFLENQSNEYIGQFY
jgi:hypothetical protein